MLIVADESVDFGIVSALRIRGMEILFIPETLASISDDEVIDLAADKKALLITEDKDFGELTFRYKKFHFGILLIRLNQIQRKERILYAANMIESNVDQLYLKFSVLTKNGLRIKNS